MHNKNLDALRGLASLNVVMHHFVGAFLPTMLFNFFPSVFPSQETSSFLFKILTTPPFTILYNGHFPVMVFFVLSGYVLSLPYFNNNENGETQLKKRLWSRYLRLNIPIAVAVFVSYVFLHYGLYYNSPAGALSGSTSWLANFYSQPISIEDTAGDAVYKGIVHGSGLLLPPLWTLRVEFLGSIGLLLLLLITPRCYWVAVFVGASALLIMNSKHDSIYFIAILSGSLISYFKPSKIINLLILVVGVYFGCFEYNNIIYQILPDFSTED